MAAMSLSSCSLPTRCCSTANFGKREAAVTAAAAVDSGSSRRGRELNASQCEGTSIRVRTLGRLDRSRAGTVRRVANSVITNSNSESTVQGYTSPSQVQIEDTPAPSPSPLPSSPPSGAEPDGSSSTHAAQVTSADADISVRIEAPGKNTRTIAVTVAVGAAQAAVWQCLTDYANLATFISGLAVNEIVERRSNGARLYQVGEQSLALGFTFRAKAVVDVEELSDGIAPNGDKLRFISFCMVEGDFKVFKGRWIIQEVARDTTLLTYSLEVTPQFWLPVALIEGRLTEELKSSVLSVANEAEERGAKLGA